jgi:tetratricopeptide (TPR) repeat protein
MSDVDEGQITIATANYVAEMNTVVTPLGRSPQTRGIARRFFNDLIETDFSKLHGSPSEWFNLATSAGQCRNITAEHKILEVAIKLHPDDVDLRCSWFQLRYGHGTIADAEEARTQVEELGTDTTAPSWRYWAYNATFLSRYLNDKKRAVEFLDQALSKVPPADMLNIYRHYRLVLIDGYAGPLDYQDPSMTNHAALLKRVEDKFREGLALGIEDGYVLAVDLAHLLRERSAGDRDRADHILDEALKFLDIAEQTYTNDGNHPLENIYLERAITLMARRRYADALQIFRSLPDYMLDDSMRVMARYAANMTGQEFTSADQSGRSDALENLSSRVSQLESIIVQLVQGAKDEE